MPSSSRWPLRTEGRADSIQSQQVGDVAQAIHARARDMAGGFCLCAGHAPRQVGQLNPP